VSRLPIRARLTLVFVVVMALVLVVTGTFLFYRTKHSIDGSIEQSLRARQGAARAFAQDGGAGRLRIPPGERFAQLLTPSGAVLLSRPAASPALLTPAQAAEAATGLRVFERSERDRYLAGPARVRQRRIVVVVGASLRDHEKALEGLGGALLVGGPLALLLAAAIAYLTAAGALGPVEAMRRRAATISTADPTALLPVPGVDDEVRRLSITLNAMLARIARSAEHERRFVADASHELRTPLAALKAELELAERHAGSEAELREAVARSRVDVERLIGLTNGLLELAGADEGGGMRLQPVAVDELLTAVVDAVGHRDEVAGGDREIVVTPSGLTVGADPVALRRALANLLENALVHGAGTITTGAGRGPGPGGGGVRIWVADEGRLHPSVADGRAFARFARGTDTATRPGAGLGLALVRSIARAHGGTVELEEPPDGGVRAVLWLPDAALPTP
jgi:signal transduction histidine kinase